MVMKKRELGVFTGDMDVLASSSSQGSSMMASSSGQVDEMVMKKRELGVFTG